MDFANPSRKPVELCVLSFVPTVVNLICKEPN